MRETNTAYCENIRIIVTNDVMVWALNPAGQQGETGIRIFFLPKYKLEGWSIYLYLLPYLLVFEYRLSVTSYRPKSEKSVSNWVWLFFFNLFRSHNLKLHVYYQFPVRGGGDSSWRLRPALCFLFSARCVCSCCLSLCLSGSGSRSVGERALDLSLPLSHGASACSTGHSVPAHTAVVG